MTPELEQQFDQASRDNVAGMCNRLAAIIRPEPDPEADRRAALLDAAHAATDPEEKARLFEEWHQAHRQRVLAEQ
jgi:hypothetical protein